jgi:hypothetical protein
MLLLVQTAGTGKRNRSLAAEVDAPGGQGRGPGRRGSAGPGGVAAPPAGCANHAQRPVRECRAKSSLPSQGRGRVSRAKIHWRDQPSLAHIPAHAAPTGCHSEFLSAGHAGSIEDDLVAQDFENSRRAWRCASHLYSGWKGYVSAILASPNGSTSVRAPVDLEDQGRRASDNMTGRRNLRLMACPQVPRSLHADQHSE